MRPWKYPANANISELTLEQLFSESLTDTPCVYLNQEREVGVATEMCVQYLESSVDSIVIRDDNRKPLGIIGGYDLLNHIRENPTRDFQYETKVKDIMFKELLVVEKGMTFQELMEQWRISRRAFAITPNTFQGYSPISARKMLEIGIKSKINFSISSMPKKKMVTFQPDSTLREVVNLMFEHNTRKLLLEFSNQFISDRLVLKEISKLLKFQPDVDNFLDVPVNQVELEDVTVVVNDLNLNQLCEKMYKMDHPYIIYKDISITPWDVCNVLLTEKLAESYKAVSEIVCPHCGKGFENNDDNNSRSNQGIH
ncbi:MAG: CBS domain-containing protein [Nitrosopumilus sp.]|uniref:CBS domain-containing protein n=1 Tax=Nitrosopumilus sp. TaxID=2024843 RepID=UPI00292F78C8|nr:CBS domain-containing protein [Nitrosopumilus sp.]